MNEGAKKPGNRPPEDGSLEPRSYRTAWCTAVASLLLGSETCHCRVSEYCLLRGSDIAEDVTVVISACPAGRVRMGNELEKPVWDSLFFTEKSLETSLLSRSAWRTSVAVAVRGMALR